MPGISVILPKSESHNQGVWMFYEILAATGFVDGFFTLVNLS
jgi:hypothetical protein